MSWIKISDAKPAPGVAVLVYLEGQGCLIGILMAADKTPAYSWWAIFSTGAHPIASPSLITHWQPLPGAPTE